MTLIQVTHSDGTRQRCDAKCHNAKHPGCKCCCGGLNHGAGTQKAIENTGLLASAWLGKDERTWACLAYREDGRLCGRPAVTIDSQRGIPVCRQHAQGVLAGVGGQALP